MALLTKTFITVYGHSSRVHWHYFSGLEPKYDDQEAMLHDAMHAVS